MERGSFILVQECLIESLPVLNGWHEGPLSLSVSAGPDSQTGTSRSERLEYFSHRVTAALYPLERRKWFKLGRGFLEILIPTNRYGNDSYLIAWHQSLGQDCEVDRIAEDINSAIESLPTIFASTVSIDTIDLKVLRSFYMVSGVITRATREILSVAHQDTWTRLEQYAWSLSTLVNSEFGDSPPLEMISKLRESGARVNLTSEIMIIVAHDGCSMVGVSNTMETSDPFDSWLQGEAAIGDASSIAFSEMLWHSVFVDCILLGIQQRSGLNRIADRFAGLTDRVPRVSEMLSLERSFAEFKAAVWWHQVTEERAANQVLRAFQREHALDDLLEELGRDLSHYSDQVQTLNVARSSAAITVLSLTLLPITVLLYIFQSVLPSNAGNLLRVGVYLLSVPIALLVALGIASIMPGYLELLRDIVRRDKKSNDSN